jgi:hypothetical protein
MSGQLVTARGQSPPRLSPDRWSRPDLAVFCAVGAACSGPHDFGKVRVRDEIPGSSSVMLIACLDPC